MHPMGRSFFLAGLLTTLAVACAGSSPSDGGADVPLDTRADVAPDTASDAPPLDAATDAATDAVTDAAVDVSMDVVGDAPRDTGGADARREPRVPTMRPITRAQARALLAYARRLRLASAGGGGDVGMAWSLINLQCTDRATAINYALAAADPTNLAGEPPPLRASEQTEARWQALGRAPAFDSARIWVHGPLVATQTVVRAGGATLAPMEQYWPYHVAAVANVDGAIEVLDLSVGDEPIPLGTWLAGFVAPGTRCALSDEDDALETWVYWMQASGSVPGYLPGRPVPDPACTYHYTPLFQNRWDLARLDRAGAMSLVESLAGQTRVMRALLDRSGMAVPDAEIPALRSRYEARTIAWMCDSYGRAAGYPLCVR